MTQQQKTFIKKLVDFLQLHSIRGLIWVSGYFDRDFYLNTYPDVKEQNTDPITHFIHFGKNEIRNPSGKFDTAFYLSIYPDVQQSKLNPLLHYILFGIIERRCPHPSKYKANSRVDANTPFHTMMPKKQVKEYKSLIEKNKAFDAHYYTEKYADVAKAKYNPVEHYIRFGWKENRNPGTHFNTSYYLLQNPDVKKAGINPLIHYLTNGKNEGRLPKLFLFQEKECIDRADITQLSDDTSSLRPFHIAVVAHLFYPDLVDELFDYLQNIPLPYTLFCSTTPENEVSILSMLESRCKTQPFTLWISDPDERDIGPFLHFLRQDLDNFDLVCKIHTKKSLHDANLAKWRSYLLQQILGSPEIVYTILARFSADDRLGMVWPVNHPYLYAIGLGNTWGSVYSAEKHKELARHLFPQILQDSPDAQIDFPAGSMFWYRPGALEPLKKVVLDQGELLANRLAIDGTILHALERCFGLLPKAAGYRTQSIYIPQSEPNQRLHKPVAFASKAPCILFITHDFSQLGAQGILFQIMSWIHQHTYYRMHLIALEMGNDGGLLWQRFSELCQITLWDEFSKGKGIRESGELALQRIGPIHAIYGNTILASSIYESLQSFQAPFISHIHELQSSIASFVPQKTVEAYKQWSNHSIACSKEVAQNLIHNHNKPVDEVSVVEEFIQVSTSSANPQTDLNVLPKKERFTVYGCGTISWRKGTDLFILTAHELVKRGRGRVEFVWIGQLLWDSYDTYAQSWSYWESFIKENQLDGNIRFTGIQKNPKEFFAKGDLFFLSSREDPFPLVCLEAADCGLPIVCFEEAGGIPGFVGDDAGTFVPTDVNVAADAIENYLLHSQLQKVHGQKALEKVRKFHNSEVSIPHIFSTIRQTIKTRPLVSVIVPVYQHAPFLHQRLESIYSQTFRDFEVILLDDASSDGGDHILRKYSHRAATQIVTNETNSGNPFAQWEAGIQQAKGDFIWIAEGDDFADEAFLATILPFFQEAGVGIAYCDSHVIDSQHAVTERHYLYSGHYDRLGYPPQRWQNNYINEGTDEVQKVLAVRNTLPNASAVLFRTSALKTADFTGAKRLRLSGDWHIYVSLLQQAWNVGYCAQPLNYHRKHSNSVVAKTSASARATLQEYYAMHAYILSITSVSESVFEQMIHSVVYDLAGIWADLSNDELESFYPVENLRKLYDEAVLLPVKK